MRASEEILSQSGLDATGIWLWGQGTQPQLPSFFEVNGVNAGLVTAVDLVRGIGKLADMKVCDIPGATGWYDTDYEGKRDIALKELEDGLDLFIIHRGLVVELRVIIKESDNKLQLEIEVLVWCCKRYYYFF